MIKLKVVLEFEGNPSPELIDTAVSLVQQAIANVPGVGLVSIAGIKAVAA